MRSRRVFLFAIVIVLWALAPFAGCFVGPADVAPTRVLAAFLDAETDASVDLIVFQIRLSRSCLALLCGGALGLSGAILQGSLRNPLADPFTLGVSAGAACGASVAIVLAAEVGLGQTLFVGLGALAGALFALFSALTIGFSAGRFNRESVVLGGVAVSAFAGSLAAVVKALNEESVTSIVFWIMGSLQGKGWGAAPLIICSLVPGLLACVLGWRKLDVMTLGEDDAAQLGVNPEKTRLWLLCAASLMSAGCVAVCGVIGFVGLVAPHISRLLFGAGHGVLAVASFAGGGLFLFLADCAARCLPDGQEIPAGVITALAGGPFFAFLIRRSRA